MSDYTRCIEVYYEFCKREFGIPPKIDAAQGKSLKQIIDYINKNTSTPPDELLATIFFNWKRLDNFLQQQTKLTQINSNLQNILIQLKNGNKQTTKAKHASDFDIDQALQRSNGIDLYTGC